MTLKINYHKRSLTTNFFLFLLIFLLFTSLACPTHRIVIEKFVFAASSEHPVITTTHPINLGKHANEWCLGKKTLLIINCTEQNWVLIQPLDTLTTTSTTTTIAMDFIWIFFPS